MASKDSTYQEYRALFLLQELFPTRYRGLVRMAGNESPDLQDVANKIGVEVTTSSDHQKYSFYYLKYFGQPISSIPEHIKNEMLKDGFFLGGAGSTVDMMYGPYAFDFISPEQQSTENKKKLIDAFIAKLNRLNKPHFIKFDDNELFIFSDNLQSNTNLADTFQEMKLLQSSSEAKFTRVYVYRSWLLYSYDFRIEEQQTINTEREDSMTFSSALEAAGIQFPLD